MIEIYVQRVIELEEQIQQLNKRLADKEVEIISLEVENRELRDSVLCEWENVDAVSA